MLAIRVVSEGVGASKQSSIALLVESQTHSVFSLGLLPLNPAATALWSCGRFVLLSWRLKFLSDSLDVVYCHGLAERGLAPLAISTDLCLELVGS